MGRPARGRHHVPESGEINGGKLSGDYIDICIGKASQALGKLLDAWANALRELVKRAASGEFGDALTSTAAPGEASRNSCIYGSDVDSVNRCLLIVFFVFGFDGYECSRRWGYEFHKGDVGGWCSTAFAPLGAFGR